MPFVATPKIIVSTDLWTESSTLHFLINNSHTNTHRSGQPGGMNDEHERERE